MRQLVTILAQRYDGKLGRLLASLFGLCPNCYGNNVESHVLKRQCLPLESTIPVLYVAEGERVCPNCWHVYPLVFATTLNDSV